MLSRSLGAVLIELLTDIVCLEGVRYIAGPRLHCALIYTNLNISNSEGVAGALMFTTGCQSVISRRTFSLGPDWRQRQRGCCCCCCLTVSHASRQPLLPVNHHQRCAGAPCAAARLPTDRSGCSRLLYRTTDHCLPSGNRIAGRMKLN